MLGEDIGMAGMASDLGDHPHIDEPQAHSADKMVLSHVVESIAGGDVARPLAGRDIVGNRAGERVLVGDAKTRVTS